MEIHYKKNDNRQIFSDLENSELLNVCNPQNYVPIYSKYFSLNESNYNNINLNHTFNICGISEKKDENKFTVNVTNGSTTESKNVHFKLSPLFDPIKFLIGKYEDDIDYLTLPSLEKEKSNEKLNDQNNAAYVDSFFTYLTSQLLHTHNFTHGIDLYGSFLAIKNDYKININDDIDYLQDSSYFKKYNNVEKNNITFTLEDEYISSQLFSDSRTNKDKLVVSDDSTVLNLSDISDLDQFDTIFKRSEDNNNGEKIDVLFEKKETSPNVSTSATGSPHSGSAHSGSAHSGSAHSGSAHSGSAHSSSTCSSRSSNTSSGENDSDDGSGSGSESGSESGSGSSSSGSNFSTETDEEVLVNISKFPIQIICLEECEKTLDSLLVNKPLTDNEWDSLTMQVIMMLITYQKVFDLTHNDLHTNNIMYNTTDKKYIEYCYNGKYYKIPTFGRIYKIIDFGRAIYKFKGKTMCSDSFHSSGDAATQYNFPPYLNEKKKKVLPNKSFDLCRLGCSLFDFIVDDLEDNDEISDIKDIKNIKSGIKKIILNWCNDDKERNVIYKTNGDERYPEFKLYKMIARTVHKHAPTDVLKLPYFKKYIVSNIKHPGSVIDIDSYPSMQ